MKFLTPMDTLTSHDNASYAPDTFYSDPGPSPPTLASRRSLHRAFYLVPHVTLLLLNGIGNDTVTRTFWLHASHYVAYLWQRAGGHVTVRKFPSLFSFTVSLVVCMDVCRFMIAIE
jgi:hypothetical protein